MSEILIDSGLLERWVEKLDGSDSPGYGWEDLLSAEMRAILAQPAAEERSAPAPQPGRSGLVEALRASIAVGRRAIGDHFAPSDCYATGPMTGDPFRDLVECPACSALAEYERIEAALSAQGGK